MSTQVDTKNENQSLTDNEGLTKLSSVDANVDFFFLAGASRGKDLTETFKKAFDEDPEIASRILQWTRDVRGGAGERQLFRDLLLFLVDYRADFAKRILGNIAELGRWDDLLVLFGTSLERDALRTIATALHEGNRLAAKWMPRKGTDANKIRSYLQLTPKAYRKMLVNSSNTVEQKMCAKEFTKIEYSKVPSLASARYQNAFMRNDAHRYQEYISSLEKGEETIHAGAVYPYDVVKSLNYGNDRVAEQQWKALPDYMEGTKENILPVIDVSGSMTCPVSGANVTAMDVSVSLGLYVSEHMEGHFKDSFITFSSQPTMHKVGGSLSSRIQQIRRSDWGMSTNIQAVFETILDAAVTYNIPVNEMPTKVMIFSDMEFNQCVAVDSMGSRYTYGPSRTGEIVTTMDMIKDQYKKAGYQLPQIVFWNLNGRSGNVPVEHNEAGVALVSGFSPALMTSLLGGEDITPRSIMLKTIMKSRYDF